MQNESYACWELRQIIRDEAIPLARRDGAAEEIEHLAERGDAHAQVPDGAALPDGPLLIPDSQKAKALAHPSGRTELAGGPVRPWQTASL